MSRGNPIVSFRLTPEAHERLGELGVKTESRNATARRLLLAALEMPAHKLGGGEEPCQAASGDTAAPDSSADVVPLPEPEVPHVNRDGSENHLTRMTRLRREWYALEAQTPALAREFGSFDEYVKRQS